jgi:[ribosomal protein S5]-alanine N-acetyltransferase
MTSRDDTTRLTVSLRLPVEADRGEFVSRLLASMKLHDPWLEPAEPDAWFDLLLERNTRDTDRSLLVVREEDRAIVGVINLSQIYRGPFRSAYLGYYAFTPFAGQGYMRAGLRAVIRSAFGELGLHRLQANIQPENHASIALVRGAGFCKEGFSPRYLSIRGAWRDHEQWVLLADDEAALALMAADDEPPPA